MADFPIRCLLAGDSLALQTQDRKRAEWLLKNRKEWFSAEDVQYLNSICDDAAVAELRFLKHFDEHSAAAH